MCILLFSLSVRGGMKSEGMGQKKAGMLQIWVAVLMYVYGSILSGHVSGY